MRRIHHRGHALLALVAITASVYGTTCTTAGPGDFSTTWVWDCGCLPTACDTLVITQAIVTSGDLTISADLVHITFSGSLQVNGVLNADASIVSEGQLSATTLRTFLGNRFIVSGNTDVERAYLNTDSVINSGTFTIADTLELAIYSDLFNYGTLTAAYCGTGNVIQNLGEAIFLHGFSTTAFSNTGTVSGNGTFAFYGLFANDASGVIRSDTVFLFTSPDNWGTIVTNHALFVGNQWMTPDLFMYPGSSIICYKDFYNFGIIDGSGSICIAGHSESYESLLGSLDLCDLTPTLTVPPYLDVNTGVISSQLSYCTSPLCDVLLVAETDPSSIAIFPNPATERITVRLPEGMRIRAIRLISARGEVVVDGTNSWSGTIDLATGALACGLYTLAMWSEGGELIMRSMVIEP